MNPFQKELNKQSPNKEKKRFLNSSLNENFLLGLKIKNEINNTDNQADNSFEEESNNQENKFDILTVSPSKEHLSNKRNDETKYRIIMDHSNKISSECSSKNQVSVKNISKKNSRDINMKISQASKILNTNNSILKDDSSQNQFLDLNYNIKIGNKEKLDTEHDDCSSNNILKRIDSKNNLCDAKKFYNNKKLVLLDAEEEYKYIPSSAINKVNIKNNGIHGVYKDPYNLKKEERALNKEYYFEKIQFKKCKNQGIRTSLDNINNIYNIGQINNEKNSIKRHVINMKILKYHNSYDFNNTYKYRDSIKFAQRNNKKNNNRNNKALSSFGNLNDYFKITKFNSEKTPSKTREKNSFELNLIDQNDKKVFEFKKEFFSSINSFSLKKTAHYSREYFLMPILQDETLLCKIKIQKNKNKLGILYPVYTLHINNSDKFIMAAKKVNFASRSDYLFSIEENNFDIKSQSFLGRLYSNFLGNIFILKDYKKAMKNYKVIEKENIINSVKIVYVNHFYFFN